MISAKRWKSPLTGTFSIKAHNRRKSLGIFMPQLAVLDSPLKNMHPPSVMMFMRTASAISRHLFGSYVSPCQKSQVSVRSSASDARNATVLFYTIPAP